MDLAIFGSGAVPKIFVAAYGSDRIGVIEPNTALASPLLWPRRKIDLGPMTSSHPLAGPRGLALKAANPAQPNDPGARLYVLNHLDASIATINPVSELEVPGGDLPLAVDPRPAHLIAGQRFLYDHKLSGSERRLAAPSGVASTLSGPAPANLRLLPLKPNTFYSNVPTMSLLWAGLNNSARNSPYIHTLRLFQWGLIQDAAGQNGFGFGTGLHHDAPRRFQVSGDNIRPGAFLFVGYWNAATGGPPNPTVPPGPGQVALISFPLYPTDRTDPTNGNRPIYETAVELEPLLYYGLMLGGPFAPGVVPAFVDYGPTFTFPMVNAALDQPPVASFDPVAWNWLHLWVANSSTSLGVGGWQRLELE